MTENKNRVFDTLFNGFVIVFVMFLVFSVGYLTSDFKHGYQLGSKSGERDGLHSGYITGRAVEVERCGQEIAIYRDNEKELEEEYWIVSSELDDCNYEKSQLVPDIVELPENTCENNQVCVYGQNGIIGCGCG